MSAVVKAAPTVDLDVLTEKFPDDAIKTFVGRGKRSFRYVQGHSVINRLNRATGNHWDLQVLRLWQEGTTMYAHVRLELPGLGSREHIGVQVVDAKAGEDIAKGAITDALKKAATLFGVAIELYGDDYEADDYAATSRANSPAPDGGPTPAQQALAAQKAELAKEMARHLYPFSSSMTPAQIAQTLHEKGGIPLIEPNAEGKYDMAAMLTALKAIPVDEFADVPF